MRSPRRGRSGRRGIPAGSLRIITGAAHAVEHREQLVRRPESTRLEHRRRGHGECFELFRWVCPQINLGALQTGMPKPEGDPSDIPCRLERVHGAGVTKNVWGHPLAADGGLRHRRRSADRRTPSGFCKLRPGSAIFPDRRTWFLACPTGSRAIDGRPSSSRMQDPSCAAFPSLGLADMHHRLPFHTATGSYQFLLADRMSGSAERPLTL